MRANASTSATGYGINKLEGQKARSRELALVMKEPHLILGIGELLWDILPDGMRLGGAPANFAVMAGRLGNHAAILSRIGRDELGRWP